MGREVRKVPANWNHPKRSDGSFKPLFDGFTCRCEDWDRECAKWNAGEFANWVSEESKKLTFEEYEGERPKPEDTDKSCI